MTALTGRNKYFVLLIGASILLNACGSTNKSKSVVISTEPEPQSEIVKSPIDKREYTSILLDNQLEIMLVSDPSIEKSAAALSVAVGSLQEPTEFGGLAHYLEHMLFLGTKSFPKVGNYGEFVTRNGGSQNAYTQLDHTNYMVAVNNDAYDEALSRFSGFFYEATLDESYADKERNAVHSEWTMKSPNDWVILEQLNGLTLNLEHPVSQFNWGNLDSLSDKQNNKLHTALVNMYHTYYSANLMKGAMISNLPLADMKKLAKQHFGQIPNKNTTRPEMSVAVAKPEHLKKLIHYIPQTEMKQLRINFVIENNAKQFAVKPNGYVNYLLANEMPGTLASVLRDAGLSNAVYSNYDANEYGNAGSFTLFIDLTETGVLNRDKVMGAVLKYLALLREKGVNPQYFNEIKQSLRNGFRFKEKTNDYFGARNRRFQIFPGSSQFKKKPQWLFAAELLETSKLYGHTAASIETDWILAVAQHLIKRQHIEPHYDARNGQVMAYEKISLYGLVIVEKKQVSYSKINPVECRKVFIRAALVEGRYSENKRVHHKIKNTSADKHFFCWQQQLLKELHQLEAKSRRRDIIVDDEILYEFYDKRLPDDVINFDGFEAWREKIEQTQPRLLFIERDQMMQRNDAHIEAAQFPDSLAMSGIRVPVMYHFDPTHLDDGVTIRVPVSALHLLSEDRLEWLVPGLLAEKVTAMIKALPKQWRKQFAPVPSTVEKILPKLIVDSATSPQKISQKPESLRQVVATQLYRYKGIEVPSACWQEQSLDAYYNFNIHVLDERGKLMDQGRNLSMLRDRYRDHVQDQLQIVGNDFEQSKLTEWSFGDLPKTHLLQQNGLEIRVFPGLVDQGDSVDLKLYDNDQEAEICSIRGMVRLAILTQAPTIKYLRKQLLKNNDLGLSVVDMGSRDQVIDDIICAAVKQTCFDYNASGETGADLCRTQKDFTVAVEATKSQWVERAELTATLLIKSLALVVAIKKQAKQAKNALTIAYAMSDINSQLLGLFYRGCLYSTPYQWLQQYPRYLNAITHRLEKVPMHVNQDRAHIAELEILYMRLQDALLSQNLNDVKLTAMNADTEKTKVGKAKSVNAGNADQTVLYYALPDRYQQYRWMLEELRVSLFAQALTTSLPVSVKRLQKQWELSI